MTWWKLFILDGHREVHNSETFPIEEILRHVHGGVGGLEADSVSRMTRLSRRAIDIKKNVWISDATRYVSHQQREIIKPRDKSRFSLSLREKSKWKAISMSWREMFPRAFKQFLKGEYEDRGGENWDSLKCGVKRQQQSNDGLPRRKGDTWKGELKILRWVLGGK